MKGQNKLQQPIAGVIFTVVANVTCMCIYIQTNFIGNEGGIEKLHISKLIVLKYFICS